MSELSLAPVVLFVYNRPEHTIKTLNALRNNHLASESELFIFSDGPKSSLDTESVEKVRKIIIDIKGFKNTEVRKNEINKGLADSVIDGVTEIIHRFGKVVVLEDDLVTSPFFLDYLNRALTFYADYKQVMHITAYNYPMETIIQDEAFFLNVVCPWGWATWERAWKQFINDPIQIRNMLHQKAGFSDYSFNRGFGDEFTRQLQENIDGSKKTWAIKWHASIYLNNGFCLYPAKSHCRNIGFDDSGTNCTSHNPFNTEISDTVIRQFPVDIKEKNETLIAFRGFYLKDYKKELSMIDSGERLLTYFMDYWTIEHLHRYSLTFNLIKGKKVIDIACGEGYGSHLMAAHADRVIGIDISEETVLKAREKYVRNNLEYIHGSILDIPLPDKSVDVVVSFETLEHVVDHDKVLSEIKRVLKEGGILIISTPDKEIYTLRSGYNNPFHIKELLFSEFKDLISRHFQFNRYYLQTTVYGSIVLNEEDEKSDFNMLNGDFNSIIAKEKSELREYSICFASDSEINQFTPNSFFSAKDILERKIKLLEEKQKELENLNRAIISTRLYRLTNGLRRSLRIFKK